MSRSTSPSRLFTILAGLGIVIFTASLFVVVSRADEKWTCPPAANAKKNSVVSDGASIQAGEKLYVRECLSCHGKKGTGDGPKAKDLTKEPGNLTTADFQSQSDGSLFWKITKGKKPMPAFGTTFSEEERWQLVNYTRSLGKGALSKSAH